MPERLKSEEAIRAICKAFADSGIKLEENVWLEEENVGVTLNGYSHTNKIGFVYMDYSNMDRSFAKDRKGSLAMQRIKFQEKLRKKKTHSIKTAIKEQKKRRKEEFARFIKDKDDFITQLTRHSPNKAQQKYAEQLSELAPQKESEALFNKYILEYNLDRSRANAKKDNVILTEIIQYIDTRFKDSLKKQILFRHATHIIKTL